MYKLSFKEAEEPEIKLSKFDRSWRKQGSSRKLSASASLTMLKSWIVWITAVWKTKTLLKRWEYRTTLSVSRETCMHVKKQQLELYMEKLTGSKLGKEYIKAVYCHPVYLTSMQSTSCKMLGWMNHKLKSRLPGEISTSHMPIIHSNGRKWRVSKESLDEVERGEWESWLKTQH